MRTNPCLELTLRKAPLPYDHEEEKRRKKTNTKFHTLHHNSKIHSSNLRNATLIFMPWKGPHL